MLHIFQWFNEIFVVCGHMKLMDGKLNVELDLLVDDDIFH